LQAKISNVESEVDESKSNRKRQQTKKKASQTQSVTIEDEATDSQVSKKKQTAKKSDSKVKSNNNKSTLKQHENPEQFKKIFTLIEGISENIQEIKKRDTMQNDKLDLAKIERMLIGIDFDLLDIFKKYRESNFDKQDNADNFDLDQNTDNLNFNFDQEDQDQQNIFAE
jgi:hypothetical protein